MMKPLDALAIERQLTTQIDGTTPESGPDCIQTASTPGPR
jgi:hypothetical protein